MINTKKKFAAILFVFCICLSACARRDVPAITTAPETTKPPVTTLPPETTVPPTTEEPHIELTREVIFQMLDDATALLNENETITLSAYQYTREFVGYTELESKGIVAVSNDNITICNTKDVDSLHQLRFLVCLTDLIERFGESSCMWYHYDSYNGRVIVSALIFYTEYEKAGYESVEAFVNDGLCITRALNTSYFNVLFNLSEPKIEEVHVCIEDGIICKSGFYTYHKNPKFSAYHEYLQNKGEG